MKFRKLAFAISAMILSTNSAAALVTENFTVTVESGEFAGLIGTGVFTYDDALLTGVGYESIVASDGLTIELNVFGQTFTERNDTNYNLYPLLDFLDGAIFGLDYIIIEIAPGEGDYILTEIQQEGIYSFSMYDLALTENMTYKGALIVNDITPVPAPAATWLFCSGLFVLIGAIKRKI